MDIQYSDLSKFGSPEGFFIFDSNYSTSDDLRIFVDNSYKGYDDYLTAVLLSHEISHAYQFLTQKELVKKTNAVLAPDIVNSLQSCFDKEIYAFNRELDFLNGLNKEEYDSFRTRILNNPYKNSAYIGTATMLKISDGAAENCGNLYNPQDNTQYGL